KVLLERTMSRTSVVGAVVVGAVAWIIRVFSVARRTHECVPYRLRLVAGSKLGGSLALPIPCACRSRMYRPCPGTPRKSQRWESNPQPPHYECGALPIEATLAFFPPSLYSANWRPSAGNL